MIQGDGVGQGKDFTLFALVPGFVRFKHDKIKDRKYVAVESPERYETLQKIKAFDEARRSARERFKIWPSFVPGVSSNPLKKDQPSKSESVRRMLAAYQLSKQTTTTTKKDEKQ